MINPSNELPITMKLLIVYGSTEGQTRKICEFLRDKANKSGHQVSLVDSTGPALNPSGFDAVIIGASVHAERYQESVKHYIMEHTKQLNAIPGIFISVSLTAAHDEQESWEELKEITDHFLNHTGWRPTDIKQVAGALRYTKYNFLKKFIMRMIAQKSGGSTDTSKDHEYTDWEQVERIITRLERAVNESTQKKQAAK